MELEDYTKFKLKKESELVPLLELTDDVFVIACNKCFKEFKIDEEQIGRASCRERV